MSERPFDVLLIGELNVDLILSGSVPMRLGQVETLVDDMALCAGSSSAIFASSASKMGLSVAFCSVIGDDLFGHYVLGALRDAGVDTRHVAVDPSLKTGVTVVLDTGDDRGMLTYGGSMTRVSAELLPSDWTCLAHHLHVASPFLLDALRPDLSRLMRLAREAGVSVSVDTNWDPQEAWDVDDLLEHTDILLPNEAELRALARIDDLDAALAQMAERVPVIAVKCGAEGSRAASRTDRAQVAAYPVQSVSTTGAGDTFDGAFIAAWLRGQPLARCLRIANVAGALTTTQVGGFNGQPTWCEAQRLAGAHNWSTV